MKILVPVATILSVVSAIVTVAFADDPKVDRLMAEKESMNRELRNGSEKVLKEFDDRESVARRAGNKQLVEQIGSERSAFEDRRTVPNSAEGDRYIRSTRKAYQRVIDGYNRMVKLHVKNKEDNLADAIESERNDFMAEFLRANSGLSAILGTQWSHPQGSFELLLDGTWQERFDEKPTFTFREVVRTRESVELYDSTRQCRVVLKSDHMLGSIGAAKLEKGYEGAWKR